jgi:hypothetical protein
MCGIQGKPVVRSPAAISGALPHVPASSPQRVNPPLCSLPSMCTCAHTHKGDTLHSPVIVVQTHAAGPHIPRRHEEPWRGGVAVHRRIQHIPKEPAAGAMQVQGAVLGPATPVTLGMVDVGGGRDGIPGAATIEGDAGLHQAAVWAP